LVDRMRGVVRDETKEMITLQAEPGKSGKIDQLNRVGDDDNTRTTVLFNAAEYKLNKFMEPGHLTLCIAIQGRNITPAVFARIAKEAGIEGAFGVHIIMKGKISSRGLHDLPDHPITPAELVDLNTNKYMNELKLNGVYTGTGTRSSEEQYSCHGHIHLLNGGHFMQLDDGVVIAVITPAENEMICEYSDDLKK